MNFEIKLFPRISIHLGHLGLKNTRKKFYFYIHHNQKSHLKFKINTKCNKICWNFKIISTVNAQNIQVGFSNISHRQKKNLRQIKSKAH